ncbi:AGC/YANK protein kinase [Pseudogymnoascus destructans 20631-21]|uniref:non-specific serine/threonine protein kinase n=1 Tax=Pseudogymnoascus destructans (strain ATCC MYA-4855 / 20631-21) TaxID=658429 RepID=L8FX70_PSED2|nr:AGC/YANK protein kinase [Pseudogymnoascus destructans 20631-21]
MGASQSTTYAPGDDVGLNHFTLGRVVGKGAFGKVRIVEHKYTKLTFALKYIRKDDIVRTESVRNIIRERRMLEHLNHPFICNLRYSFQDTQYMYLVVDLMSGGDLRFHIARKSFTEDAVKFWIAELGCALKYIHKQGIIHRDVKPDNVLLDSEGHIHLADFNVASDYTPRKPLTSKSGSQPYLSPEVWAGTGYGPAADWWSLGVLFYECIYNKRPFDTHSAKGLGELIMNANPSFPVTSPPVTMPCMHAVSSALEPDPTKRLGATWQSFIDNPFFRSVDFEALERKEIEPVFVPSKDKTNFDATYDLEELLLEEAPLEARTRRQKPREPLAEGATDKEIREDELYRMIETGFMPFDYTLAAYTRFQEADDAAFRSRPPPQSSTTTPGSTPCNSETTPSTTMRSKSPGSGGPTGHRRTPSISVNGNGTPINSNGSGGGGGPSNGYTNPNGHGSSPPSNLNAPVRLVSSKNGGYRVFSTTNPYDVPHVPHVPPPQAGAKNRANESASRLASQSSSSRMASKGGDCRLRWGRRGVGVSWRRGIRRCWLMRRMLVIPARRGWRGRGSQMGCWGF